MFAHEDRTKAQQVQRAALIKVRNAQNAELEREKLLDNPFRYIIRGECIRCIKSEESRQLKKSVYVSDREVKMYIDGIKRLSSSILTNTVATRCSFTKANQPKTSEETAQQA